MATEKKKWTKFTVEVVDNGFVVEKYSYNPYGADLLGKTIRATQQEVIGDFFELNAHNAEVEAEKKAKEKANDI